MKRTRMLRVLVTPDEAKKLTNAAKRAKLSLSSWARITLLLEATQDEKDHTT